MPRSPWIVTVLPRRLKPSGVQLVKAYGTSSRRLQRLVARWFPEPKHVAIIPIADFLQRAHFKLLELQRRQYVLEAVDAEWARITRGKNYSIHDAATFRALGDVDAMNVIDLCSWAIGASDADKSLLVRVKNHYLAELPASRRWGASEDDPWVARRMDRDHAEARSRLFPKANGRPLAASDAEDLIETFENRVRPLRDDRNKNRAHAHEHKTHGSAKLLDITGVREMYRYARDVLNDLCLIALGTAWAENDINSNSVELTAEDLLDVVFLPTWFRRDVARRGMSRQEIYDALHAHPGAGDFNDRPKLESLL